MLLRVINRGVFLGVLLVLCLFSSCNEGAAEKENYLYHQNIKELIKANEKEQNYYKLFLKADGKKDTIILENAEIIKKLAVLFKYGLRKKDLKEYKCENYEKEGYSVVEISALETKQEVRKLFFKKNQEGHFYYLIKTNTVNRLANYSNEMSFSSTGNFLIISNHEVPLSYKRTTRVEGKLIDNKHD